MYDLVVIGGGCGGLNVAVAAAQVGARVALIEKDRLGGEGTFAAAPSKGLVQAAKLIRQIRGAERFGLRAGPLEIDFAAVMSHVRDVVADFAAANSDLALRGRGIDVIRGSASFEAYDSVKVDGATLLASKRFVVATGSRPAIPAVPGLAEAGYLDSHSLWSLSKRPDSLIVLGAETEGVELAQCFARLGSTVTVVTHASSILSLHEPEAADFVARMLAKEGIAFQLDTQITRVELRGDQKVCKYKETATGVEGEVSGSHILVTTGRLANVEGLNLEAVGAHGDPDHGIEVDECLQTHSTRVFALGDVLMRHHSEQAAEREAAVVFQNAVLKLRKKFDHDNIPSATFVDPEVASVGTTEAHARHQELAHRVYRVEFAEIDRARIDGRADGFAKVVTTPTGKVLGATVVGEDASLIIQEFVLACVKGLRLGDIAAATPIYPTYAGVARHLANQHQAARLGSGYVQTALKLFYGFIPRHGAGNGATDAARAAPVGGEHATVAHEGGH